METVTSGLVVLKKDEWECPRGPAPIWTSCRRSGPTAGSAGRLGPPATGWPASFAALPSAKNSALLEDTMKRVVSLLVFVFVLAAGVAFAQQTPTQPGGDPHHQPPQGGGTMGMMSGQSESPRMMQMRGEMMKAMGDIMMKYGKMME